MHFFSRNKGPTISNSTTGKLKALAQKCLSLIPKIKNMDSLPRGIKEQRKYAEQLVEIHEEGNVPIRFLPQ
jgi:hypothetical protein